MTFGGQGRQCRYLLHTCRPAAGMACPLSICTDRGVRMFERDKNSPAVLLWSLGNESGARVVSGIIFELATQMLLASEMGCSGITCFSCADATPGGCKLLAAFDVMLFNPSTSHSSHRLRRCPPGDGWLPAGARHQPTGALLGRVGRLQVLGRLYG